MIAYITQYLRPDGRKRIEHVTIPDSYQQKIDLLKANDCELNCEQLTTGKAAQYISWQDGEVDVDISPCGSEAVNALLRMLDRFSQESFDAWKAVFLADDEEEDYPFEDTSYPDEPSQPEDDDSNYIGFDDE